MSPSADRLDERLGALLAGAAAAEVAAGAPAGARQLLDLADAIADAEGHLDPAELRGRGLDRLPAGGPAGLLLRGALVGVLSPLDRPRLRQGAHRLATLCRADEGTAMTVVATAVLAADLCRFDLGTALVRLRQTLLEEAPSALHLRLRPLGPTEPAWATGDPGDALQLAITALDRSTDLRGAVEEAATYEGEPATAAALAGALGGARSAWDSVDPSWRAAVPAAERVAAAAARLAAFAIAGPPRGAPGAGLGGVALARLLEGRIPDRPEAGPSSPRL